MKTTIFVRILLATLLPLFFVFIVVITTISNIIYVSSASQARQATLWEARYTASQFSEKIGSMINLLSLTSEGMAEVDHHAPEAVKKIEKLLRRLMLTDQSIDSVWFAFEPKTFPGRGYVYQTLLREGGSIYEIYDITDEIIQDPERSPWYHGAVATGRIYVDMAESYDYGLGQGPRVAATVTVPIIVQGAVLGAVGLDANYESMLNADLLKMNEMWHMLLITEDGKIVFSLDKDQIGQNIFENLAPEQNEIQQTLATADAWQGEAVSPLSGAKSLLCIYPINAEDTEHPVFLYLDAKVEDIYSVANSSMELIISTSLLGLALLGFSVFIATRNIVRPIKRLTTDFDKVSSGNAASVAEVGSHEDHEQSKVVELDILRSSLHKMLAQINQTHELRLKAKEEQVEKEKVLAASQAKNQFFASMSHEIRTPMNAILGISEILLLSDTLAEKERKYISDIKTSSASLLGIINDILDISSLESGKLTLAEQNYNFDEFLDNIRTMGEYLASPNNLDFIYSTQGDLPTYLYGDDTRLRQVLVNLVSNACKFTKEGSVSFSIFAEDKSLRFIVSDTGTGISEDEQAYLFEPFQRVSSTTIRNVQGTGLGLSIAKNLVDLMGGTIALKSEMGQGSTFTVTIPKVLGEKTPEAQAPAREPSVFGPDVNVLIVDDNEINLTVAEGLLEGIFGIKCDLALSGAEAIEKIQSKDYALVFMDQMMPEMDGIETTKKIREMGGKYATIPIVALTANAVKGAREELLAAGINDYLSKPIEIDSLEQILRTWVIGAQQQKA